MDNTQEVPKAGTALDPLELRVGALEAENRRLSLDLYAAEARASGAIAELRRLKTETRFVTAKEFMELRAAEETPAGAPPAENQKEPEGA